MSTFDLFQQHRASTAASSAEATIRTDQAEPPLVLAWYAAHLQQWLEADLLATHGSLDPICRGRSRCLVATPAPRRDDDDIDWTGGADTPSTSSLPLTSAAQQKERLEKFLGMAHRGICGEVIQHPVLLPATTSTSASVTMSAEERNATREMLSRLIYLTVSHRHYTSRKVLLDEVAAYSAASLLYNGFREAFSTSARRSGGTVRVVAATPEHLKFSELVGVVSAGDDVPLRRFDSCDWTSTVIDVSSMHDAVQPLGADSRARDVAAAFLHHSWAVGSGNRCMCEVKLCLGDQVVVVAVHTNSAIDIDQDAPFGATLNGQRPAIAKLIFAHRCTAVCRQLGLTPLAPLTM